MMKKKEKPLSYWQKQKPKADVVAEAVDLAVLAEPVADKDVVLPVAQVVVQAEALVAEEDKLVWGL
jgi:hypothetical protein